MSLAPLCKGTLYHSNSLSETNTRSYTSRKPAVRKQHCSRSHKVGHNSLNKLCAAEAAREITDDFTEDEVGGVDVEVADLLDENIVTGNILDDTANESVVDPEDLLGDSDDDLF